MQQDSRTQADMIIAARTRRALFGVEISPDMSGSGDLNQQLVRADQHLIGGMLWGIWRPPSARLVPFGRQDRPPTRRYIPVITPLIAAGIDLVTVVARAVVSVWRSLDGSR